MPKAATKTTPERPLALVHAAPISHALTGTIDERMRAFDQIAANIATLALNGWDTVQKVKAGCWLADGKGEHPAVFIENHYVMLIKGRLTVEPKWEYMVRKLKETVPNFRFKVLIETDDCAKVWMSDGVDQHEVEYTLADAKRQGLLGRDGGNMWTTGSTREGCFKQAVKRCARRIGVGRSSLPWVDVELPMLDAPEPPEAGAAADRAISEAVVIEDEPAVEAGGGSEGAAPSSTPATPPADGGPVGPAPTEQRPVRGAVPPDREAGPSPAKNPVLALSTALVKMYGKQPVAVALEKASLLYNEAMKASTGVEHSWIFKTAKDIGPVQAQQILDYLATRKTAAGAKEAAGGKVAAPAADIGVTGGVLVDDEPPAPEADDPPPAETAALDKERDITDDYDNFLMTVKRAKKLFGRKFVTEAPVGSGKFWFLDQATFSQIGKTASLKLMDNGEITVSQQDLQQLHKILVTDCDAAERGGR